MAVATRRQVMTGRHKMPHSPDDGLQACCQEKEKTRKTMFSRSGIGSYAAADAFEQKNPHAPCMENAGD
jgi:hypothetical protein